MAKTLQEEIDELRKENDYYKTKGAVGLYYELNRVVNDTVNYSRTHSIESLIAGSGEKTATASGDKKFERLQMLLKNAKEHTEWMDEVKDKLGITGDEQADTSKKVSFLDRNAK